MFSDYGGNTEKQIVLPTI